jgi:hypothetical protein
LRDSASAAEAEAAADEEDGEVRGEEEERGGRGPASPAGGGNGPPEVGAAEQRRRCHGASRRHGDPVRVSLSARAARSPVRVRVRWLVFKTAAWCLHHISQLLRHWM